MVTVVTAAGEGWCSGIGGNGGISGVGGTGGTGWPRLVMAVLAVIQLRWGFAGTDSIIGILLLNEQWHCSYLQPVANGAKAGIGGARCNVAVLVATEALAVTAATMATLDKKWTWRRLVVRGGRYFDKWKHCCSGFTRCSGGD